jgi:hypothetical protein
MENDEKRYLQNLACSPFTRFQRTFHARILLGSVFARKMYVSMRCCKVWREFRDLPGRELHIASTCKRVFAPRINASYRDLAI